MGIKASSNITVCLSNKYTPTKSLLQLRLPNFCLRSETKARKRLIIFGFSNKIMPLIMLSVA